MVLLRGAVVLVVVSVVLSVVVSVVVLGGSIGTDAPACLPRVPQPATAMPPALDRRVARRGRGTRVRVVRQAGPGCPRLGALRRGRPRGPPRPEPTVRGGPLRPAGWAFRQAVRRAWPSFTGRSCPGRA